MDESNTRLREARKKAGFKSARSAALRFGWTTGDGNTSTYASHENGQTPIPKDRAIEYARALKVAGGAAWLLGVENKPPKKPSRRGSIIVLGSQPEMEFNDAATVPEFDMTAGAIYAEEQQNTDRRGDPASSNAVRANWGIPTPFLEDELHIRSGRAHMLRVRGDSMADALFDGDRAIIDLEDTDVRQGGIFALLDDIAKLIIIQVTPVHGSQGRRILCTYANPRYPPFELPLEDPVKIIGRIAAKITRL